MEPYTPGYRISCRFAVPSANEAWSDVPNSLMSPATLSHLSGRHSEASCPQTFLSWFAPKIDMITLVFASRGMAFIREPFSARVGNWRGRIVDFRTLWINRSKAGMRY